MFKNYLIVALRHLSRHKIYTLINVLGLAIGIACCIPILLYIYSELGYNSHFNKKNRIYRVLRATERSDGSALYDSGTPGALSIVLKKDYPEVEQTVRTWTRNRWLRYGDQSFFQTICLADPEILSVFDFRLKQGNPFTALSLPGSMLITQETAHKIFGTENPIGKTFSIDAIYYRGDYTITGVLENLPRKVSLKFDVLTSTVSNADAKQRWEEWGHNTSWHPIVNYILLSPNADPNALQRKLIFSATQYHSQTAPAPITYHLQSLTRIHLYTRHNYDIDEGGDIKSVYVLTGMACFILFIACINFMNLATARSILRAREVGIRKVVGASRIQLIGQFIGEAIGYAILAFMLALVWAEMFLSFFNSLAETQLTFYLFSQIELTLMLVGITLFVGLLAGSYPALFFSAFRPAEVLKSTTGKFFKGIYLRQSLVIFQFAVSAFLIIGTMVVRDQMTYVHTKNLGFDKKHILFTPLFYFDRASNIQSNGQLTARYQDVKQAFLQIPGVLKASASRGLPGNRFRYDVVLPEGHNDKKWQMHVVPADEDFLDLFGIELIAGRNFFPENSSDATKAYILNETAAQQLGWADPIGKQFEWPEEKGVDRKGQIIGVVKDFHMDSLHKKTGPVVICMQLPIMHWLSLKLSTQNMAETIVAIETTYKRFIPHRPFAPRFLDEHLTRRYYENEMRLAKIFNTASFFAIFIACLGLFGLATFIFQQRTKELSIRKVLGASLPEIVWLFYREFALLVVIANAIAWPITYFFLSKWLQDFAYRIDISFWLFPSTGILTLIVVFLAISFPTVKAVKINPIHALRQE